MKSIFSTLLAMLVAFVVVGCSQEGGEGDAKGGVLQDGLNKVGNSLESVKDKASDVVDGTVSAVEGAADKAGEMANEAVSSAKEVAADVGDSVGEMAASAESKVSDMSSSLKGDAKNVEAEADKAKDDATKMLDAWK